MQIQPDPSLAVWVSSVRPLTQTSRTVGAESGTLEHHQHIPTDSVSKDPLETCQSLAFQAFSSTFSTATSWSSDFWSFFALNAALSSVRHLTPSRLPPYPKRENSSSSYTWVLWKIFFTVLAECRGTLQKRLCYSSAELCCARRYSPPWRYYSRVIAVSKMRWLFPCNV